MPQGDFDALDELGRSFHAEVFGTDADAVENAFASIIRTAEHVDILLVNGRHVDSEYLLRDGDILSLLPMVEGG